MSKYPAYSSYKPSGVAWLGDVPAHWEINRFKNIFKIKKDIAGKLGFDVLSITQKGIKIKDIESGDGQLSSDYTKYQHVKKGDFAMNHMDLLTGFVDLSKHDGVTSPDYRVFTLAHKQSSSNYFLYILQMGYFNKLFYPFGQGASQFGRWRLPTDAFNEFITTCPPKSEQTAIVDFLNVQTAKIDVLIRKQQRMIELLGEKRSAMISHAVTKGLNPKAAMKPSGVAWLGDVPAHWGVKRLRFICKITTGGRDTVNAVENGAYPFYVRSQTVEQINSYAFDGEAILTAGDGAGVGKVFHYVQGKFDFHQRVYMFYEFSDVDGKFLFEYIKNNLYKVALEGGAKSTVDSLRLPLLQNFEVTAPPSIEQIEIIRYIGSQTSKIDILISKAHRAIALLRERRSALISAAVTGQIDIRNAS